MSISRAECKKPTNPDKLEVVRKAGCYGMVGRHYDFTVRITGVHDWGHGVIAEGEDRLGRKMLIRFNGKELRVGIAAGGSLFFRGLVLAHDSIFGVSFTFIEATSKPVGI